MKKHLLIWGVILSLLFSLWVPGAFATTNHYVFSLVGAGFSDDWPVYTSAPAAGTTISGHVYAVFNKTAQTTSDNQYVKFTVSLIRDGVTVSTRTSTELIPADITLGNTATVVTFASFSLDTAPSSYIAVKLVVKDLYSGTTLEKTKYIYPSSNPASSFYSLSPSKVTVGSSANVMGVVKLANGQNAVGKTVKIYDSHDNLVGQTETVGDGSFATRISFNVEGDYKVVCEAAVAYIKARYSFVQSSPDHAVSGETISVGGTFKNASGHGVSGLHVGIFKNNVLVKDIGYTTSDGSFTTRWTAGAPGDYHIGIIGTGRVGKDYGLIHVTGVAFNLSANVSEVYGALPRPQTIQITVSKGSERVANTSLTVKVKNNSNLIISTTVVTNSQGVFSLNLPANLFYGTLNINVVGAYGSVYGEGSLTLSVVRAQPITIEVSGLSNPVSVGEHNVVVTAYSNLNPPVSITEVKVVVTGDAETDLPDDGIISNGGSFHISTFGYGTFTISVTAKDGAHHVITKSFTYTVDGYRVSYSPNTVQVDSKNTIQVVVKDKDNNPINNAIVKIKASESSAFKYKNVITSEIVIDGRTVNIVGGKYIAQDISFLKVTDVSITVYAANGSVRFIKKKAILVEPKMTLTVVATPSSIVAGDPTMVSVVVKNSSGNKVSSTVYILDKKNNILGTYPAPNGAVNMNLLLDAGDYVIKAYTSDKKEAGQVEFHVLMADLTLTPTVVTAGEKTKLHFVLKNPISGGEIYADEIYLTPNSNVQLVGFSPSSMNTESTGTFTFTPSVADTSTKAEIVFKALKNGKVLVKRTIKVGYPDIEVSPKSVYMNTAVDIKITLKDAAGKPMAGRKIILDQAGTPLATLITDSKGQTVYRFNPTVNVPLTVKYGKYASTMVGVSIDPNPPAILSVTPASGSKVHDPKLKVTVTVEDKETYISEIYIGFKPVFFANNQKKVTVSAMVELDEGENVIPIVVRDSAGNVTSTNYLVTYEKVVKPPVIVGFSPASGSTVTEKDIRVIVHVRAGSAHVKTLFFNYQAIPVMLPTSTVDVPVQVTLQKGKNEFVVYAVGEDDQVSEKVIYTLYYKPTGHTVVLTIGSAFYKVDDETKTMDVYPFIDPAYGRTMVPLRFIASALGYNIDWNGDAGIITITGTVNDKSTTIRLFMGKPQERLQRKRTIHDADTGQDKVVYEGLPMAEINGKILNLKDAGMGVPFIWNGRTFVPIRFIAEAFGAKVDWDPVNRSVIIEIK